METRVLPKFKDEAEEARWWFDHRDEVARDLVTASREGRSGEGSKARYARKLAEAGESKSAPVELVSETHSQA